MTCYSYYIYFINWLYSIRESEIWKTGKTVRNLRPENK